MKDAVRNPWLLLIHQVPPKPDYFRVKVSRRLQRIGAVAIKNTVYALPNTPQAQEAFQWVLREIVGGGGEAMICEVRLVEGLTQDQVVALFHAAREADYQRIVTEAGRILESLPSKPSPDGEQAAQSGIDVARLKRHLAEASAIDFFRAPARAAAEKTVRALEVRLHPLKGDTRKPVGHREEFRGRTWVTRVGIEEDRIASAWLIRRFIDPKGRFRFVSTQGFRHKPGELRFDMFEAEFTHDGDRCSFEVLLERFGLTEDPALKAIGEIVHDIDLKDEKFRRPDTKGIERVIAGLLQACPDDAGRLERGSALLDDLYGSFSPGRRKGGKGRRA